MENPVLGEWLVLFLLFLNCSRIFFLKYGKVDSLAVLAPVSILFSVLQIFAWGVDCFSAVLFVLSIFAFFINFRALLRFSSGLYVDHYSVFFKFGAILTLIITLLLSGFLVYFRPVLFKSSDFRTIETKTRLSGDFTNGFSKAFPFEFSQGEIHKFFPEKKESRLNQDIIIMPDKTADVFDYKILACYLVEKGYNVYIGEFFARDGKWCHNFADYRLFRRIYLLKNRFFDQKNFNNQIQFYTFNMEKECRAMLDYVLAEQGEEKVPVCFVGDWMSNITLPEFEAKNKTDIVSQLNLCDFEEYKTPGMGFVQYTAPIVAKQFGLNRETDFTSVKSIAEKIIQTLPAVEITENFEIKEENQEAEIDAE